MKATFLDLSIGQIGYVVKDVDSIIRDYYTKFGIGDWKIYTYGAPLLKFMNYHGKAIQYKARIALSYFGKTRIELIQNLEGHTIYTDFIKKHGYGVQHLGIYVQDIQKALKEAQLAGFSVVMDGGGFGLDDDGHFAYLDTEEKYGITYELIQRPLRRHEPEAVFPVA
ncbi:MAG: VOC family protein [Treponema sp.]|jgi:hypothetical protein|nr:VOC family protein [Treponema sp.]